MIPAPVYWFAIGAVFGLVLCGWPWHPRFSRYQPRRRRFVPHSPPRDPQPRPSGPGPVLPVLPAPAQPRPRRRQTCR
jgi:hypothetical protein